MKKTFLFLIVLFFAFAAFINPSLSNSEDSKNPDAEEVARDERPLFEDKGKIVQELRSEFNLKNEDLAFIFSVRGAQFSIGGFDLFKNQKALLSLVSLYMEAKERWKKPLGEGFFPFFSSYVSEKLHRAEWAVERDFQLKEAERRFLRIR